MKLFELKEPTENTVGFIEWFVDLLKKKRWVKLIVFTDISIFLLLNPLSFNAFYDWVEGGEYFGQYIDPNNYKIYWLIVIVTLFLVAAFITYWSRPKISSAGLVPSKDSAIKGLIAFTFADAKSFEKLGRSKIIRQIGNAICEPRFRIGILSGESGCGKSSLLQAGLWPYLEEKQYHVVYIQCNELQPLESIKYAICDQLNIQLEQIKELTLEQLLDFVTNHQKQTGNIKKTVLILDQFEQFFIQQRLKKDRKLFIKGLRDWYFQKSSTAKILISLRSDLAGRMVELQNELKYSLGPNQNFLLEKFEPSEATRVFKAIIDQERIEYDEAFIDKLCQQELANPHDGLISPVDLQILAWMIAGKEAVTHDQFDEAAFQRLGGMDGLLNNFLNQILKSRETENKRQIDLKLLLALIDLDNNLRAGVLTESELVQKTDTSLTPLEVKDALQWLTRPDVRLVTPRAKGEEQGFELAHERIITTIRSMANKTLTDVDLANQLLTRRTNEWIGNNRSTKYLLNFDELRLIQKQSTYLVWQTQKAQKKELIQTSKNRYLRLTCTVIGLTLISFIIYGLNHLPEVQIWKVKRELLALNEVERPDDIKQNLATAFFKAGMLKEAISVTKKIKDPRSKAETLQSLSESAAELNKKLKVKKSSADFLKYEKLIGQLLDKTIGLPHHEENRDLILIELSKITAELDKWSEARDIIRTHIKSEQNQMAALIVVLNAWTARQSIQ